MPAPCLQSVADILRTARTLDGSLDQAKACTLLLAAAAMTMTFVGVLLGSTVWQLVDRIRKPVVVSKTHKGIDVLRLTGPAEGVSAASKRSVRHG